jgi:type I restriction enzyme S subunit
MSELPEGWTETKLGDVCKVVRGITFPASAKQDSQTPDNVCCLRTTNVQKEVDWDDIYFVSKDYVKRDDQFIKISDILMSMANSYELVGKVSVVRKLPYLTTFGAFISAIRPFPVIEAQYLFHTLRTAKTQSELREGSSQTVNIANISVSRLSEIEIPLAPLPEQKRIADKIDTLLARVDRCQSHLERVPQILKQFRQSVLAAATSGRLTEDWREAKGRDLSSWNELPAGDLIEKIEAGINVQCDERPPLAHERGLVKISAVTWGKYNDDESKTLPVNHQVPEHTRIKAGDFLISRANTIELVGACVIVEETNRPVYLSDKVLRLVMKDDIKRWMLYWLRSNLGRKQIESLASGNQLSMRNISQANLRIIQVNIPPSDERDEIVRRVERLFAFAARLEARWQFAHGQVASLTPALLAKAFRGELVKQDAEDESAQALLERIRESRELASKEITQRKPVNKKERTKTEVSMLKRNEIKENHLSAILKERGALTAEALWSASQLDIDEFYDQLKNEEAKKLLREVRETDPNAPRLLEAL